VTDAVDPGTGRVVDAALQLLDRQIVDRAGRPVANVDDLEIEVVDGVPLVTAMLSGLPALGPRLGGLLGRTLVAMHRRLHPRGEAEPKRIPFSLVAALDAAVHLSCDETAIPATELERWVDEQIVQRIPGNRRAGE
jgi:hypothetical protein